MSHETCLESRFLSFYIVDCDNERSCDHFCIFWNVFFQYHLPCAFVYHIFDLEFTFVNSTSLVLQQKYKCLNYLLKGTDQPNKGDCNSFVTLLANRFSQSNTYYPSSKGTSADTTSNCLLENDPLGIGMLIFIEPSDE